MPTTPPAPTPTSVMTPAWCDKLQAAVALVAALTADQAAWAAAVSISVAIPYSSVTSRSYTGSAAPTVIAAVLVQVNADLAAAQLALANFMAGK